MKKIFITFEGIDGCGKSTQIEKTACFLKNKNINHIITREPGGTVIAEKIRELILSMDNKEMVNYCELLLYLAARAQHVQEKIIPALEKGIIVLCDRFQEATFVYQGFGRELNISTIKKLNCFATNNLKPNRTYIFDLNVETAIKRMKSTNKILDRLENNKKEFFVKIRNGYLKLAINNPKRIKIIEAEQSIEDIQKIIQNDITKMLFAEQT